MLAGRKQIAERSRGIRLSLAGRWPPSLRLGSGDEGRQNHHPLAQRARTGSGERRRRSRAYRGGAVNADARLYPVRSFRQIVQSRSRILARRCCSPSRPSPLPTQSAAMPKERYLSPLEMAFSPDGRLLYVVARTATRCESSTLKSRQSHQRASPSATCRAESRLSSDGRQLYVTNSWSDTVSVIDTTTLEVVQTLPTGSEPSGVVSDHEQCDTLRRQPPQQRHLRHRSQDWPGDQAPAGRTRRQLPGIVARRQVDLLHAHLSESRRLPHASRSPRSRSSILRAKRWSSASRCTTSPASSTWRSRPMASSESPRSCGPRI